MDGIWSLQSDAVVGTSIVIEENEALNLFQSLLKRIKPSFLTIYAFTLDCAVHALCKGVVGGFIVLCHRYPYAMFLQFLHVEVAAVLDAAVRVMNESREVTSSGLFDGHAEGFKRENGCKGFCQTPAHDFLRISISYEMQVAASTSEVDVGDIALPQLVSSRRFENLDEIFPLVVAVVGIGRGTALARLLHEPVATQEVQKRIAARLPACIECHAEHRPEFHPADARIKTTDFMYEVKDTDLTCQFLSVVRLLLVKGLTAMAKQLTGSNDGQAMLPVEFFYCLAPDFFLISMPLRSATSINVFRARFCSSSSRMRASRASTSADFSVSFFLRAISSLGLESACKDTTFFRFL